MQVEFIIAPVGLFSQGLVAQFNRTLDELRSPLRLRIARENPQAQILALGDGLSERGAEIAWLDRVRAEVGDAD